MNKEQYLILMDTELDTLSPYKGAITILREIPWYCTGLSMPTIFDTEKKAQSQVKVLEKKYPDRTFDIIPVDFYLSLVDQNWRCEWLQSLRQEQQSLLRFTDPQ